ncbi:hypothetical protein [Anaerococcus porci]|uniref:hypothetical protein n=1 Tax=Anaerococcus porci TaxID=2652269 RepID=UPI002A752C32|nr:hypothetical protein [Anaerococcus porci]MDY3006130.1 hypothetical protein [Anaerococcus porci]
MSEFLGPIHYMMYDKIKFQDEITNYLLDGNTEKLDKQIKAVSRESLDTLIDQENIHGWLDSKIDVVENRLAYAIKNSDNAKGKLFEFGKKKAKDKCFDNFNDIFSDLNMYLLDGMPCDNGLSASIDKNGDLFLITNVNCHEKYFKNFVNPEDSLNNTCEGGHSHDHHESFEINTKDFELRVENSPYHLYRYEFLKGYFDESDYQVDLVGGINYRIYKK